MRPKCHSTSARSAAIAAMLYKQMLFTWQLKWSQMYSNVKIIKRCQKHLGIYWYWCDTWQTRRHTSVLWTHTHTSKHTHRPRSRIRERIEHIEGWIGWIQNHNIRCTPHGSSRNIARILQRIHGTEGAEPLRFQEFSNSCVLLLFLPWDTCFFQRQCDFRLSSHLE